VLGFHATQDPISGAVTPALSAEPSGALAVLPIQESQRTRERAQNGIGIGAPGDPMYTMTTRGDHAVFAFDEALITRDSNRTRIDPGLPTSTLARGSKMHVGGAMRPRRLTPRECERLQGFPDDYTAIPGASDSARYEALGNSMAVPVMAWIGRRIAIVDGLTDSYPLTPLDGSSL